MKCYGFSIRDVYIDPETGLISRAVYKDKNSEIERTMDILDIKLVEGSTKYRPMHLTVYNHKNKRSSDMIVKKILLNSNLLEDLFTTRYIEE